MNNNAFTFTKDTATIVSGGRFVQVKRSEAEFPEVIAALNRGDYVSALQAVDRGEAIRRRSSGAFQVLDGVVLRNGVPVHNVITTRILEFIEIGLPFKPLLNFYENLMLNPSKRAVDELYSFLEHENLPITEQGHFLAYKSVRSDFKSKTAGREEVEVSTDGGKTFKTFVGNIPNDVGNIVRIKRNLVDDDKDRTCSNGLHIGALAYAGPGGWFNASGDKVVIVDANPRDAVSVPADHDANKLRVCEYTVVSEFNQVLEQKTTPFSDKVVDEAFQKFNTPKAGSLPNAYFRCRTCRSHKKKSTFRASTGFPPCPKCGSSQTHKL